MIGCGDESIDISRAISSPKFREPKDGSTEIKSVQVVGMVLDKADKDGDFSFRKQFIASLCSTAMSTNETETEVAIVETQVIAARGPKLKKLKPARKQVKAGDVEKKETPQTGKEYSKF